MICKKILEERKALKKKIDNLNAKLLENIRVGQVYIDASGDKFTVTQIDISSGLDVLIYGKHCSEARTSNFVMTAEYLLNSGTLWTDTL